MGDLLPDGKIRSVETLIEFASPSAWAYNCKSFINKIKKAGCGWSSVSINYCYIILPSIKIRHPN